MPVSCARLDTVPVRLTAKVSARARAQVWPIFQLCIVHAPIGSIIAARPDDPDDGAGLSNNTRRTPQL
jgi:hypothetical protein